MRKLQPLAAMVVAWFALSAFAGQPTPASTGLDVSQHGALRGPSGPPGTSWVGFSASNNGTADDLICTVPIDVRPPVVDFSRDDQAFDREIRCEADKARSMVLRSVPAGRVFRVYADPGGRLDDDWAEIIVRRDIREKVLGTFEKSFGDRDVRVLHHRRYGLDGRVSRLEIDREPTGPVIDLYADNGAKGGVLCSVLAKYLRAPANVVEFTGRHCSDDRARSLVLHDFPAGAVIRLYDSAKGDRSEDWAEILVKRDLETRQIDSFQTSFDDEDVRVTYFHKSTLDGKVSRLEVGERPFAALPVWVGLSDGERFRSAEWAHWRISKEMKVLAGDFNGDGRTDVIKFDVPSSGTVRQPLWVGLSDGATFKTSRWEIWHNNTRMKVLAGDFNGDGRTDVMKFDVPASGTSRRPLWVGLSDGTKLNTTRWATWHNNTRMKVLAGDFNGDGKTDVVKFDVPASGVAKKPVWVGLSDGTRFNASRWATWHNSKRMRVLAGDFDGDGRTDMMKVDVPASGASDFPLWVGLSDGTQFSTTQWGTWPTNQQMKLRTGDFNGDGKTDVMRVDVPLSVPLRRGLWIGLSNGAQFKTTRWATWDTSKQMRLLTGDFNGDGMTDVMKLDVPPSDASVPGALWVGLSDGSRFNSTRWAVWRTEKGMHVLSGDFNGDGKTDVVKFDVPPLNGE